jgi:hypothetical protein
MAKRAPFLTHGGVSLYRIAKHRRELSFWYSLLPGRSESDAPSADAQEMDFDVRTVAAELQLELTEDNHADILRAAIDKKWIKPRGIIYL